MSTDDACALVVGVDFGTSVEARLEPMGRLGDRAGTMSAAVTDRSRRIHQPARLFRPRQGQDLLVAKPSDVRSEVQSGGRYADGPPESLIVAGFDGRPAEGDLSSARSRVIGACVDRSTADKRCQNLYRQS